MEGEARLNEAGNEFHSSGANEPSQCEPVTVRTLG
jgi:hypothetical protein